MLQKAFVPPVVASFLVKLYKSGAVKVVYVVLQYERFDTATVKQTQSAGGPPTTINEPFSQSGECFVLLYCTNVILSEQQVANGLWTRTRNRWGIQGRDRTSTRERMTSTSGWI